MENVREKPVAKLLGADCNVFNLLCIASKALKSVGMKEESNEMSKRVFASSSYDEALAIMMEYVEVE